MTILKSQVRQSPVVVTTESPAEQAEESVTITEAIKSKETTGKAVPTLEAIARRNRRARSPIDGRRNIMTVKGLAPGMVGRWADNTPERMDQLLEQGYEVVRENVQVGDVSIDSGTPMGAVVTKRVGGGREQILMQIPKTWYDADQAEKQKTVDEREATILNKENTKAAGFYGKTEVQDIVPGQRPRSRE